MSTNLETTTVKDISYLINSSYLRAPGDSTLETLGHMLCTSDRYKVYLEDPDGRLTGVLQAKQIAMKLLELSRQKSDEADMLPSVAYVLNFHRGAELAAVPVTVQVETQLQQVLELMHRNSIREIPVVDAEGRLAGVLEAKHILAHYLQAKAETEL